MASPIPTASSRPRPRPRVLDLDLATSTSTSTASSRPRPRPRPRVLDAVQVTGIQRRGRDDEAARFEDTHMLPAGLQRVTKKLDSTAAYMTASIDHALDEIARAAAFPPPSGWSQVLSLAAASPKAAARAFFRPHADGLASVRSEIERVRRGIPQLYYALHLVCDLGEQDQEELSGRAFWGLREWDAVARLKKLDAYCELGQNRSRAAEWMLAGLEEEAEDRLGVDLDLASSSSTAPSRLRRHPRPRRHPQSRPRPLVFDRFLGLDLAFSTAFNLDCPRPLHLNCVHTLALDPTGVDLDLDLDLNHSPTASPCILVLDPGPTSDLDLDLDLAVVLTGVLMNSI
ncbi:uncharacterized protein BXZ73DRAFT_102192 [Epithele typhae]|uniref:uncharacterized protein n=1 Tax=Epithele typhae TaxID=378194 RepID=UPI0020089621|nr:uncharacterized protein BXZ73DRAFT_102192 [Epithele typhae]KAH9929039.1 hypothetical protein BXZ73DRAFT_102192 [Epithele typhae]